MIVIAAIKTSTGEIFKGRKHHMCIRAMVVSKRYPMDAVEDIIHGFLDDEGNFLDRTEAKKHFVKCGQPSYRKPNQIDFDELFSEDLYPESEYDLMG